MASKVFNNIAGLRVLLDGQELEDVIKVTLPDIEHTTTDISSAGMVADVKMPDMTHFAAMEVQVQHNNGRNCNLLAAPGKHTLEVRTARQVYDIAKADISHVPDRYRMIVTPTKASKGDIEKSNPYGTTNTLSVLRYEEVLNSKTVTLIDAMAGVVSVNGKEYSSEIDNLLK
jgi:phage tail tube protein FII